MAQNKASYNRVKTFFRDWSGPVIRALYLRDSAAAEAALALAREHALREQAAEDQLCASQILLDYLEYLVKRTLGKAGEQGAAFQAQLDKLSRLEPAGEVSQAARRVVLLIHRIRGERDGWGELDPESFYSLFNFIPPDARDVELWHHAASWAFDHSDGDLLGRAYEVLVIEPSAFPTQYPFYRAKLMHAILEGTATRDEVEGFCRRLDTSAELAETREVLWPRLADLGLIDSDLERLLAAAELRVAARVVQRSFNCGSGQ